MLKGTQNEGSLLSVQHPEAKAEELGIHGQPQLLSKSEAYMSYVSYAGTICLNQARTITRW